MLKYLPFYLKTTQMKPLHEIDRSNP